MQGTTRARIAAPAQPGVNAAVWIEPARALVARAVPGVADPTVEEVVLTSGATAIADVAHKVADADRVLVLGPDDLRLALERELVVIGHHPERLREEPASGRRMTAEDLVARLRRMPR
jgi:ribonucleotide monophosphatase NagD (HAD superfamily)